MICGINEILEKAIKENSVVSIFTDSLDKAKCSVGFIYNYNNDEVLIKHLCANGESDGYAWRKIEDIYRIDLDGLYENNLKILYKLKNQNHDNINNYTRFDNILKQIICFAKDSEKILEISIDSNNEQELIIGLVKNIIDNETMVISRLNDYGKYNGITIINICDIVSLNCDSKDSKDLLLLSRV